MTSKLVALALLSAAACACANDVTVPLHESKPDYPTPSMLKARRFEINDSLLQLLSLEKQVPVVASE
jgi:hypothetical protein